MIKSWRTTLGGVLLAIGAFFVTQDFDFAVIIGQVINALGALLLGGSARDNNVSSEEAGAAKPAN